MKYRVLTIAERKAQIVKRLPHHVAPGGKVGEVLDMLLTAIAAEIVDMERSLLVCMPDVKVTSSAAELLDAPAPKKGLHLVPLLTPKDREILSGKSENPCPACGSLDLVCCGSRLVAERDLEERDE